MIEIDTKLSAKMKIPDRILHAVLNEQKVLIIKVSYCFVVKGERELPILVRK